MASDRVCVVAPLGPDVLPTDRDVVLLGPWCRSVEGAVGHDAAIVPPYGDEDPPSSRVFDDAFDEVVRHTTSALDAFHGVTVGHAYWSVLVGQFMSALLPVVADLRLRLASVASSGANMEVHGSVPALIPTTNRDGMSSIFFDADTIGQLASGVAGTLDPPPRLRLHRTDVVGHTHRRAPPSLRLRVTRTARSLVNLAAYAAHGGRAHGAWVQGALDADGWRAASRLREPVLPVPHAPGALPTVPWLPWDDAPRDRLARAFTASTEAARSDLARATLTVAHLALPWRFVEGWSHRRDFRSLAPLARRRLVVSAFPSEHNLTLLATSRALGAKLAFSQHGGNYGEGPVGWAERYERRVGDGFMSWGWRDDERGDVFPAPNARLAEFVAAYGRAAGRTDVEDSPKPVKYYTNFNSDPPHGFGIGASTRAQRYGSVDDVLRLAVASGARVSVRRHPKAPHDDAIDPDLSAAIDVEDPRVPNAVSIAGSSLVVLDLFGSTTFLECIAVGHPVVLFLAHEPQGRDPEQTAAIAGLRAAGVISVGVDEMAAFWRERAPDVRAWWLDEGVVAAVERYRARHALATVDWIGPYSEAIQAWFDHTQRPAQPPPARA